MKGKRVEQLVALGVLLLIFGVAAWDAVDFRGQARTFPLTIGLAMAALVVLEALLFWTRRNRPKAAVEKAAGEQGGAVPGPDEAPRPAEQSTQIGLSQQFMRILPYLLWLLGLYGAIYLLGMVVACGLFAGLFLWRVGNLPWYTSLAAGVGTVLFLMFLGEVMNLRWPDSQFDLLAAFGIEL